MELEDDVNMDDDVSSSSDEEEQTERPYNELLQLLQTDADTKGPARKRRKVAGDSSDAKAVAVEESEDEAEADALQDQAPSDDEEEPQEDEDDDAAGPFEKHFNLPDGSDLPKKIEQIQANKWVSAKKEVDGLRFVQSIPDMGDAASLLPAIKSTANLKVCLISRYPKFLFELCLNFPAQK
jgi:U3 small nucleolar RNA-associated protein 25